MITLDDAYKLFGATRYYFYRCDPAKTDETISEEIQIDVYTSSNATDKYLMCTQLIVHPDYTRIE